MSEPAASLPSSETDFMSNYQSKSRAEQFTDASFPPCRSSLHSHELTTTRPDILRLCERAVWMRAEQLFSGQKFAVLETVQPSAVHQGILADCYFLSSLSSLAKNPDRVRKLFLSSSRSPDGCYRIYGFINGVKKLFEVDDYFVTDPTTNSLAFAHPEGRELWVLLLEKLWAKVNGSFTNIEYGEEFEALNFLTGAPTECYVHTTMTVAWDELWVRILTADRDSCILTCSTKTNQPEEAFARVGLQQYHVYSLLRAAEVRDAVGKTKRLLVLRDPQHMTNWRGSSEAEKAAADTLVMTECDCFAISFEKYMEYFKETTICRYIDSHLHTTAETTVPRCSFSFAIEGDFMGYIGLNQHSMRVDLMVLPLAEYSPVFLVLARVESDRLRYITSLGLTDEADFRKIKLVKGRYVIFAGTEREAVLNLDPPPYPHPQNEYSIHLYGNTTVQLGKNAWDARSLASIANDFAEANVSSWEMIADGLFQFDSMSIEQGFGVRLVKCETTGLRRTVEYKETINCMGMKRIYPQYGGNKVRATLATGDSLVCLYLFTRVQGHLYKYVYEYYYD